MATIVTRAGKGTPLTNTELDSNFTNLNTDKVEVGGALGTPSSGTVTNLTGTASININGTVGATTANTGAFTTLSASSPASFAAGTAALPSITRTGDTNTGLFFPAADTIALSEGGVEAMRIDSSGNMIMGRTSAFTSARVEIQVSGTDPLTQALNNNSVNDGLMLGLYNSGNLAGGLGNNVTSLTFYAGGATERMRITSAGNVGIGTTAPAGTLQLRGSNPDLYITADDTGQSDIFFGGATLPTKGLIRYSDNSDFFGFSTNTTERLRITSTGNVGIGTTAPAANVHVTRGNLSGFVSRTQSTLTLENVSDTELYIASGNTASGQVRFGDDGGNFRGAISYNHLFDAFLFYTVGTERLRINSAGNVGIGTTAPVELLHVAGNTRFGQNKQISFSGGFSSTTSPKITLTLSSTTFPRISFFIYCLARDGASASTVSTIQINGVVRGSDESVSLVNAIGGTAITAASISRSGNDIVITLTAGSDINTIEGYVSIIESQREITAVSVSD